MTDIGGRARTRLQVFDLQRLTAWSGPELPGSITISDLVLTSDCSAAWRAYPADSTPDLVPAVCAFDRRGLYPGAPGASVAETAAGLEGPPSTRDTIEWIRSQPLLRKHPSLFRSGRHVVLRLQSTAFLDGLTTWVAGVRLPAPGYLDDINTKSRIIDLRLPRALSDRLHKGRTYTVKTVACNRACWESSVRVVVRGGALSSLRLPPRT